jgi:hypothetical protein
MATAVAEHVKELAARYTPLEAVVKALHRPKYTVFDLVRKGKLPVPIKAGGKYLFRTDALMRSLEALEAEAEAAGPDAVPATDWKAV